MNTPFDKFFDYDNNGSLDWAERSARDAFIMNAIDEELQYDAPDEFAEEDGSEPEELDDTIR